MQKGAKPVQNDAERQPQECGRAGRAIRFVGRALRKASFAAVPLLASLALGCEPDECVSHNDTTTPLNRPTDGRIAPLAEFSLPPQEGIISETAIDLVNESQALSTGGMPGDASLTVVPQWCMDDGRAAYATRGSLVQDRGIYSPGPVVLMSRQEGYIGASVLFHELGHLQRGGWGNEVIPELNRIEQLLMVHVLLHRNDPDSQKMWGVLMRNLEDELYSPTLPSRIAGAGTVQKIAIFNLMELIRSDGDFRSVRERIIGLESRDTLLQEIDASVNSYASEYGDPDPAKEATGISNLAVSLRMSFAREISRRFGTEAALAYLRVMSHKAVFSEETMTEGMGDMNCAMMDSPNLLLSEPETDISDSRELCPELETTLAIQRVPEQRLCCASPAAGSTTPDFHKYVVSVDGYNCTGYLPLPAEHVMGVRHLSAIRSVQLPDGAQCE